MNLLLYIKIEQLLETSLTLYLHGPGGGLEQRHFQDHGKTNKSGRKVCLGTSQCHSPVLCFPFSGLLAYWIKTFGKRNTDSTSKTVKRVFHPEFRSAYPSMQLNDLHAFLAGLCFCIYIVHAKGNESMLPTTRSFHQLSAHLADVVW